LGADDLGGVVTDREVVAVDGDLGHVLDEHGGSSDLAGLVDDLVEGQAVPAKMAQFAGAPPDLGLELHDRPDIGPMTPLQQPEGLWGEELVDDRLGQRPALLVQRDRPHPVPRVEDNVVG